MQWDGTANAGFTTVKPWIKLNENYQIVNVNKELQQKNSILNTYKSLLKLRNSEKALQYGSYGKLEKHDDMILFSRTYLTEKITVMINFGKEQNVDIPKEAKILMGNSELQPNDFLIFKTKVSY